MPEIESSFDHFLQRVEPILRKRLATIPSGDAEDILQRALLATLYQWEKFEDSDQAVRWLLKFLSRGIQQYRRAALRQSPEA